jgi:putative transposase
MSHSITRIWIHALFSTKDQQPTISPVFEGALYGHMKQHLQEDFGCPVRNIGGTEDHVHLLFLLDPGYAIRDLLKNIKGESSHWVNQQNFLIGKFSWQIEYGAYSVSNSKVREVERFLQNQKAYHKNITFLEEFELFSIKHGLPPHPKTV